MSDGQIKKIMSASLAEFHRSMARLVPGDEIAPQQRRFSIEQNGGCVDIVVEDLPPKVAGGLLNLPQLKVTFSFSRIDGAARQAFIGEFDKVFQRGGG